MADQHAHEATTQRVFATLQANLPNVTSAQNAVLPEIAEAFATTWHAFQTDSTPSTVAALAAQLVQHGFQTREIMEAGRALLDPPADRTAPANIDQAWQFQSTLIQAYTNAVKQAAQQATLAEVQATQQREDQLRAVIQELSTPIIPIYRGVLVLPLVGAIDSMRSQEITERLLEEIVHQQADLVIIDITGVSVVDTSVANHLIMTAQAVNLLGSRVIFTGISSTIAQTIIQLGVNLGDVVTLSNLQAGMLYALEQLGLGITELEPA